MSKIQNVGVGGYIRGLKGIKGVDSRGMNSEVWKVMSNEGNSFKCCPVTNGSTNPATIDTTRFMFVPIDTNVSQVSISPS